MPTQTLLLPFGTVHSVRRQKNGGVIHRFQHVETATDLEVFVPPALPMSKSGTGSPLKEIAEPTEPCCPQCDEPGGHIYAMGQMWHQSCLLEFASEYNQHLDSSSCFDDDERWEPSLLN